VPTYQYACTDCGHGFEAVQSFSDDSLTVCPSCEGRLRKIFNAVGVVFKGSGFYRNDSRAKDSGENGKKSDSSVTSSTGSKDSSGKDSSGSSDSGSSKTSSSTGSPSSNGSNGSLGGPKSEAGAA
jgi:putative FmdB family regulatory protein